MGPNPTPPPAPRPSPAPGSGGSSRALPATRSTGHSAALEAAADRFLSVSASSPDQRRLVHPPPLPRDESGLDRVRTLAARRAWVDVLAVSADLLNLPAGPYARWHRELCQEVEGEGQEQEQEQEQEQDQQEQEQDQQEQEQEAREVQAQAGTCELLRLRLSALLRLRRHADLAKEVERLNLLDGYDIDGGGELGSGLPVWVDVALIIMAGSSLLYTDPGDPDRSLDALSLLREVVSGGEAAERRAGGGGGGGGGGVDGAPPNTTAAVAVPLSRYLNRIDVAVCNAHMRKREWRLALSALDTIYGNLDGGVRLEVERRIAGRDVASEDCAQALRWLERALTGAARIEVRSRQGWIFLQTGSLDGAERMFALAERELASVTNALREAEAFATEVGSSAGAGADPAPTLARGLAEIAMVQQAPARVLVNAGLLGLARQDYEAGMSSFEGAMGQLQAVHSGEDSAAPRYRDEEEIAATLGLGPGGDGGPTLISHCLNNLALCALYKCRYTDAVNMMESLVREGPSLFLTERLAFNLCTLYELGSDAPASDRKKRVLQVISKRFFLHDIGSECFRVSA